LRIEGKPALQKFDAFVRGDIEVQDEGSQLLALLVDAKRGEMVVDFCAGAGGKTLALGAAMRHRPAVCLRRQRPPARRAEAAHGAQRLSTCTRPRSPTSATTASSAWPARSTGCWSTPRARAWARCAATPT
jgi:16S rRNA C967 or C1407 C5-methylase (RsmB/RsmF family)